MTDRKVALITGASRGIGAAIVKQLAADGFAIVVNYARSRNEAENIVAMIEQAGGMAIAIQADVSRPDEMLALFDAAEVAFERLDVLVNNAGLRRMAPLSQTSDEDFDTQVAMNIGSCFRGMREGARRLRDGGRIINTSASMATLCTPNYGVYAGTKAAIEAMTRVLAKELAPRAITVNAVAPGPVETDGFARGMSEALMTRIVDGMPAKRLGKPSEIASVVSFLASPQANWVSGQTIQVNAALV